MWASIIGVIGVIAGVILNEAIRRSRRIEIFTPGIFEKRLKRYEKLMSLLESGYDAASEVMSNEQLSKEERHELISVAILSIAQYADSEQLYIDPELGVHCVATFMGAEDVLTTQDPQEREERRNSVGEMYLEAKRMIREYSGISEIDKLFKKINKPKITGPVIKRIRYLKKHGVDKSTTQTEDCV